MTQIGETISQEQFSKTYPVGTTLSADAFKTQYSTPTQPQTSFGKKVFNFFTSNEQKVAQDIANVASMNVPQKLGGTKDIAKDITKEYIDAGTSLLKLAHQASDPTKQKQLLQMAKQNFDASGKTWQQIYPTLSKSNLQIIGDFAGVALDILAFGTYGKATVGMKTGQLATKLPTAISALAKPKAIGFVQGAIQGAKGGAKVGALLGSAYGAVGGAQEGKAGKDILIQGVEGGMVGAIAGGTIGGITGGISGSIQAKRLRAQQNAISAIVPQPNEISSKDYEQLVKQGRITPKTKLNTAKIIPTNEEKLLATQYQDLLQDRDPVKNMGNVMDTISKYNDHIGNYLKDHPSTFNKAELKSLLIQEIEPLTDINVANEKALIKAKERLVDNLINSIPESNGVSNNYDLFKARQKFDAAIRERLRAFSGAPNLKKDISKAIRDITQQVLADSIPEDTTYQATMKAESDLFKIAEMVNTKAIKEKGLSAIQVWIKNNPRTYQVIKWSTIGIIGTKLGKKTVTWMLQ